MGHEGEQVFTSHSILAIVCQWYLKLEYQIGVHDGFVVIFMFHFLHIFHFHSPHLVLTSVLRRRKKRQKIIITRIPLKKFQQETSLPSTGFSTNGFQKRMPSTSTKSSSSIK